MLDFSRNYFELFHLTPAYALDVEALDSAYRQLQTEIHPDRFAHAGEADQRLAVQWAARANEAYKTLKSPFARANYLLELQGIQALDANNTAMPMDFLVQQMEWRETLAEAIAAKNPDALEQLEQETRSQGKRLLAELTELLDQRHDYNQATEVVRKYRFIEKFQADIGDAFDVID